MKFHFNQFPSKERPDAVREIHEPLVYYEPQSYSSRSRYEKVMTLKRPHVIHTNKFMPQPFERSRSKPYHETVSRRVIPVSEEDQYYVVTSTDANRLDILAFKFYNDCSLWWILADANPSLRFNPYNVPRGSTVRIPSMSTIYGIGGVF